MWTCFLLLACGSEPPLAPPPPEVPVTLDLSGAWRVAHQEDGRLALQLGDTSDGVQLVYRTDARGRMPGITPIQGGRALEVLGDQRWPWFGTADPDAPITGVDITVEGPDLVVRLLGAPLSTLHPEAPDDPVRLRVRVRHRGDTWRLAADGLLRLHLDGDVSLTPTTPGSSRLAWSTRAPLPLPEGSAEGPAALSWTGTFGSGEGRLEGPRWQRLELDGHTVIDTQPSLSSWQPYPELGFDWTP